MYVLKTMFLRDSLDKDCNIKITLKRGDRVKVLKKEEVYSHVTFNDENGYVLSRYLSRKKPENIRDRIKIEADNKDREACISDIECYFSMLPEAVQKMFNKRGVSFFITDKVLKDNENIDGTADGNTFRIIIKTYKYRNLECIRAHTFYHECGHMMDFIMDINLSDTEEIKNFYINKTSKMVDCLSNYAFSSILELYAEIFATYMCEKLQISKGKGNHHMEEKCPELFQYIKNTLAELEDVYETYWVDDMQEEKTASLE